MTDMTLDIDYRAVLASSWLWDESTIKWAQQIAEREALAAIADREEVGARLCTGMSELEYSA